MIRSMTGFGRHQALVDGLDILVEIKSVNHRYFEYTSRLQRAYGFLDDPLKAYLQNRIARGKVEAYVLITDTQSADSEVTVNFPLAEEYVRALRALSERFSLKDDLTAARLASWPDVLSLRRAPRDEQAIWRAVETVAETALEAFLAMRRREGERLAQDILSRAETLSGLTAQVEARAPDMVREHMEKVTARMRELLLGAGVDEQRLLTEAALFADKTAVDEETVRLHSHLHQLRQMAQSHEAVGRKLDFLVQEIHRETNTIGSKIQDIALSRVVVEMKAEIEKIREQVQNIE